MALRDRVRGVGFDAGKHGDLSVRLAHGQSSYERRHSLNTSLMLVTNEVSKFRNLPKGRVTFSRKSIIKHKSEARTIGTFCVE